MSRPLKPIATNATGTSRVDDVVVDGAAAVEVAWRGCGGFDHHFDLLPDGCIDIVFERGALLVLVPALERRRARVEAQARIVGVRIRCGWGAAVLGRSLAGFAGHKRPLTAFWGTAALEFSQNLARLADDRERALALAGHVEARLQRRVRPPTSLLDFIQSVSADDHIVDRPVTSRALYDSCMRHVAVAPAALRRLMRFQAFLGQLPKAVEARAIRGRSSSPQR